MSTTDRIGKVHSQTSPEIEISTRKSSILFQLKRYISTEIIKESDDELNNCDNNNPCSICDKPVSRAYRALDCTTCQLKSRVKCSSITPSVCYETSNIKLLLGMPFVLMEDRKRGKTRNIVKAAHLNTVGIKE